MVLETQEQIEYEHTVYKALQDEKLNIESELEIERSRNRKLRKGVNVSKIIQAINMAKGERVS